MIWKTSRDSTRIPTKDGSLAVRVDGDPHKDPLLLCQRFRGTMDDWDPEFVARMVPAEHSFALAQKAPRAKLILYPDAGHAFLFQYAEDFCAEVLRFTASLEAVDE